MNAVKGHFFLIKSVLKTVLVTSGFVLELLAKYQFICIRMYIYLLIEQC